MVPSRMVPSADPATRARVVASAGVCRYLGLVALLALATPAAAIRGLPAHCIVEGGGVAVPVELPVRTSIPGVHREVRP